MKQKITRAFSLIELSDCDFNHWDIGCRGYAIITLNQTNALSYDKINDIKFASFFDKGFGSLA